jgi:hypothetical protein
LTGNAERLSELPALLDQPPITDGVRKLYEMIVSEHPIGIPTGAGRVAIWPLLSKRMTLQLETAQACQDDYSRQHPVAGSTPKPGWLKSGLFSGESNRALPFYADVERKVKQSDGSFSSVCDPRRRVHRPWTRASSLPRRSRMASGCQVDIREWSIRGGRCSGVRRPLHRRSLSSSVELIHRLQRPLLD